MPIVMGRSPKLWPEPDKVMPERWIGTKNPSFFAFPVFQAGPRICLGMNMANLEAKVLTCMILKDLELKRVPGHEVKAGVGITMCSRTGLMVTVHPRAT